MPRLDRVEDEFRTILLTDDSCHGENIARPGAGMPTMKQGLRPLASGAMFLAANRSGCSAAALAALVLGL
jgi:hypothetical protein